MPRPAKSTPRPRATVRDSTGTLRSPQDVARWLLSGSQHVVGRFGYLLRPENSGAMSVLDCAHLAAKLKSEDPRIYPAGRPVSLDDMARVQSAAMADLAFEMRATIVEGIQDAARERRWPVGLTTVGRALLATDPLRCARCARAPRACQAPHARYQAIVRAFVEASMPSARADVGSAVFGTDRDDQDPEALEAVLSRLFAAGNPLGAIVPGRTWRHPRRQTRRAAGVSRASRTEGERRCRGVRTVVSSPLAEAAAAARPAQDPNIAVEAAIEYARTVSALRDLQASTVDPREQAACAHLLDLDGLPLVEAADRHGVSRKAARLAVGRVRRRVAEALAG